MTPQSMPVSHPYITASIYLNPRPLQTHNGNKIIKSQCNNIFCAYDKLKYNHEFYLYYNEDSKRWAKTLFSINNGNMRVQISGLYMGYHLKGDNGIYHAI